MKIAFLVSDAAQRPACLPAASLQQSKDSTAPPQASI
jgi:hypothetical protein